MTEIVTRKHSHVSYCQEESKPAQLVHHESLRLCFVLRAVPSARGTLRMVRDLKYSWSVKLVHVCANDSAEMHADCARQRRRKQWLIAKPKYCCSTSIPCAQGATPAFHSIYLVRAPEALQLLDMTLTLHSLKETDLHVHASSTCLLASPQDC